MWAAGIKYDDGRLGHVGCYGMKTRDEAIDWLDRVFDWKRCWFMIPSVWIRKQEG